MREAPAGTVASVKVGDATFQSFNAVMTPDNLNFDAASKAREDALKKEVSGALTAAGYPAKADTAEINKPMLVLLLFSLVLYVTMVYGPIAAMLVEMFPTRIRYTSMSLPYHIGNGWFGGMLPLTATAVVAATGNIYAGLWYPVLVAAFTAALGILFIRETKDHQLHVV